MKRSFSPHPLSSDKTGKTFHIEPFRVRPKRDSREDLNEAWAMLKPAIGIIFRDEYNTDSFSCNTIFMAVRRACFWNAKMVREVYQLIRDECEPFVYADMRSLEKHSSDDPSVFLPLVEKCWLGFKKKMMFVNGLAYYEPCDKKTIWDMGKELYQKQLSLASEVEEKVIASILDMVTDERLGKTDIDMSLLKNLMEMFKGGPGVIEKRFIDSTAVFYAEKSVQALEKSDLSEYMKFVEDLVCKERKREQHYYLFLKCWRQLESLVKKELLEVHISAFEKGFTVLMDEGRVEDLRRMYGLFYKAGLVCCIDQFLRSYISDKGRGDGSSLPELMSRVDMTWHECFEEDDLLDKSIRECFKDLGMHMPDPYALDVHCGEGDPDYYADPDNYDDPDD